MAYPSKRETVEELKQIYTDPVVLMFVLVSLGAAIASGSLAIGIGMITILSFGYLAAGKHR